MLELQILLTRRDTYLKFLYDRELDFSEQLTGRDWRIGHLESQIAELKTQIDGLEKLLREIDDSPSVRIGKAVTWPARRLRPSSRAAGRVRFGPDTRKIV